jgi:phospholipid transport system substrate-binding protein
MLVKKLIIAMIVGFPFLGSAAVAASQTPVEVIESAVDELAAALDGRRDVLAEDRDELYEIINGILLPRFDRTYAARLVLARHWKTASDDQKRRFIDAYYNSMLQRYADGVLEFQEDQIEIMTFRGDLSKPRVQAKTMVRLDDGSRVPVDYAFVNRNDAWKIFDVTVEGVSFVRNFRAELDSEIRETSLDAVIERLETEGFDDDAAADDGAPAESDDLAGE